MRKLKAVDLFCGAGGSTTGAEMAGVNVVLAVNHWRVAIYSHEANHPGTRHICARIDDIDPRNDATIPDHDILMASPECTHHSIARGGRPIEDQKRATPWHVCVWAEAKRPKWLVIENVREFESWGPLDNRGRPLASRKGETFRAWVRSIESLGYQVDHQLLNAADYGEATKRVRLFIVARRGRSRKDIPWPAVTHRGDWRAAHEIIDWSRPCPSIFSRAKPLAEKTLRRIEIGLRKFVGEAAEPFIVKLRGQCNGTSAREPLDAVTAGGTHHGLAVPFQFKAMGRNAGATKPITDPLPTIVAARENHAIVFPFLTQYHNGPDGERRNYSPDDPLPTLDTQPRYGLVAPYMVDVNHGGADGRCYSVDQPLGTVTTKRGQSIVLPFLTKYYGSGVAVPVTEPLDTVTTKDRFGLAMVSLVQTMRELGVVDIGFRMLDVDELAAAQGFPAGYVLHGTKAEQIRQVGNAVCPRVMKAICGAIAV